jgi:hypothetical protein
VCILAVNVDIDIESFVSQPKVVVTLFNECRFGQRLCGAVGHLVSRFDPSERHTLFVNALPYPMYFRAPVFDCRRATCIGHCANNCLVVFLYHRGTMVRKSEVAFKPTQFENFTHAITPVCC